jgi:hypothetical protein
MQLETIDRPLGGLLQDSVTTYFSALFARRFAR